MAGIGRNQTKLNVRYRPKADVSLYCLITSSILTPNNKNKVGVTYETNTRINKFADTDTYCSRG